MELFDTKTKCKYAVYGTGKIKTGEKGTPGENVVYLVDLVYDGHSISNNVDTIAEEISAAFPNYRIVYRDTNNLWEEITIGKGYAQEFSSWHPNWHPENDDVNEKAQKMIEIIKKGDK